MKVFWSWQNDLAPERNRYFIKACLEEAVREAGVALGLEDAERPEVDHDTKDTPGLAEIANTILRKIADSAVFVADVTPLGQTKDGKALPNPNVLIELGWALKSPGVDWIICVFNASGGWTAEKLPFDIRHRRAMQYELPEGATKSQTDIVKKRLTRQLSDAIQVNLRNHIEKTAADEQVFKISAKAENPSIWASAKETVTHDDIFARDHSRTIALAQGSRSYARIAPASWKNGPPSVHDIRALPDKFIVWPPLGGYSGANQGACEDGYIRYWFRPESGEVRSEIENAVSYFDETGEFWILHGSAAFKKQDILFLDSTEVLKGWLNALRRSMAVFDRFGSSATRYVEVGLVGVRNARWISNFAQESAVSRKDAFIHFRQSRDWTTADQKSFLAEGYSKLRNTFALPKATDTQMETIFRFFSF